MPLGINTLQMMRKFIPMLFRRQTDQLLIEEAEKIFCNSLGTEPTLEESRPVAQTEMTTLPTNKVGSKRNRMGSYTKEEKPSIDFSLGFVLTGECHEL